MSVSWFQWWILQDLSPEDLDFIINLESQLIYDKPARNKNNAYAYKLSSSQFKSGKGGDKSVKKVIQINLVKEFVGVGNLEGEYELSDIKLQKKQEFTADLKTLTRTLETRSESAKQALKNNTLDLTKITMIGTRRSTINTEIEPHNESSKKFNVEEGTRTLKA